jgi:hypothetical protein
MIRDFRHPGTKLSNRLRPGSLLLAGAVALSLVLLFSAGRAFASGCRHGARDCLRGVVRNQTGGSLRLQTADTSVAGSTYTKLPHRVVGRGNTSTWAVQPYVRSQPMLMVLGYRAGSRKYSLAAVRATSGQKDDFVACWEPKVRGGGASRSCAASWGAGRRGSAFEIGGHPSIPAVGERCQFAAAPRQRVDCTADGQIPVLASGHARRAQRSQMVLDFVNVGSGPVRISVGHLRPCTIRSHGGRCSVTGQTPGGHVTVRNLRRRRAKVGVEIVAEADGPHPPADLARYQARSRGVSGSSSDCTSNYDNQGGAYWDGDGPGWPVAYPNGATNHPWPSGCSSPGNWMSSLSNGTKLDQLTLPGTHDTGTYTFGSGLPEYWAQSLSIPDQLTVGIRAFDIRLENEGCPSSGCGSANPLGIYHGRQFTGGYLNSEGGPTGPDGGNSPHGVRYSVMSELQKFLNANPTETIVMNIQDENTTTHTPGFSQQVNDVLDHYEGVQIQGVDGEANHPMVYDGSQGPNPPLWAVRGEVVVIADGGEPGSPSDYTDPPSGNVWPQTKSAGSGPPFVQDDFSSPDDKWTDIYDELNFAATQDPYADIADGGEQNNFHQDLNINFTSASAAAEPRTYAGNWGEGHLLDECKGELLGPDEGCNILTANFINQHGASCAGSGQYDNPPDLCRYGFVYTDFPGPTLINALIGQNPQATSANLRVQQSPSASSVPPGGTVTYTVPIHNTDVETLSGDVTADASNAGLNLQLPAGATLQGAVSWSPFGYPANWAESTTPSCQAQQGTKVQCSLGTVPEYAGLTATYTVQLAADASGQQTSSASVSTSTPNTLAGQSTTATTIINAG